ncbi:MAG: tRNA guanosine(34) transglycosylase Tgt [Candidatus Omnitrophica bacterium]|nr:tRNA guanosine(34) transglycosylase Tgt [Candidatus Omnitrophota bacterium]
MNSLKFEITSRDPHSQARTGIAHTAHGSFETPLFMPVATQATVKTVLPRDLKTSGAEVVLANAYHLFLRPGLDIIQLHKGLHRFMDWHGPILTDSGGFQVFSLTRLRKITEEGARFQSHLDGKEIFLTPENVLDIQAALGSDIAMVFDECPPSTYDHNQMKQSMNLTLRWAKRAKDYHWKEQQSLFGIVQGGTHLDLRKESLERTVEIGFDGYALGGLFVGEDKEAALRVYEDIIPAMPEDHPRYLMGVGTPLDFVWAVEYGADMFDCVTPTRYGRVGTAFTDRGLVVVRNGKYREDLAPLMEGCDCYTCTHFTRSYLRHLFNAEEMLGPELVSLHNVHYFIHLVKTLRQKIREGKFLAFKKEFLSIFDPNCR